MREGDDIRDYLSRFMSIVDKLQALDIDVNGDLLSVMLLHSLPTDFDNFCCAIKSRDNLPDIDALMIKIIEEADSKAHKGNETGSNALLSKHQHSKKNNSRNGANTNQRTEKNDAPNTSVKYKCSYCKRKGHKVTDCYRKTKDDTQNLNNDSELFCVCEDTTDMADSACNNIVDQRWCLDSGCTSHLCNNSELFTKTQHFKGSVRLANDATASVKGKGDVKVTFSKGKRNKPVTLQNTLYVPNLRMNLLSVAKIVDRKHQVLFTQNRAYVKDASGNVKMVADRMGDLFCLQESDEMCATSNNISSEAEEWHRRLGHLNWQSMQLMSRNNAVTGFDLKDNGHFPACETCAAGKFASIPFPERGKRTSAPLEIVHADVCGPMRTSSNGGARYFLTFTDDFSRWTEVYFLKHKSEVSSRFLEFKNYAETQTGRKIRALQSDNGGEFCNSIMDGILKEFGIRRRLTTPHTPQQNGVAERKK